MNSRPFDVFISHRWSEVGTHGGPSALDFARGLKRSLEGRNIDGRALRVFLDESDVRFGEGLSREVSHAIRGSTLFVPVLSADYFESLACSTELTEFLRESFADGNFIQRVFPVDIAPNNSRHHYRETPLDWKLVPRIFEKSDAVTQLNDVCDAIGSAVTASHASKSSRRPGTLLSLKGELFRDDLFVGRNLELLQLFRALLLDENRMSNFHGGQAQIVGPPGQGKTLLAHQFVEWFGSIFAGGCSAFDAQALLAVSAEGQVTVDTELLVSGRHPEPDGSPVNPDDGRVPGALWILDNLDPNLSGESVRNALGIHPRDKLLITRIASNDEMIRRIELGPLTSEEAIRILADSVSGCMSDDDRSHCVSIAEALDHYALAIRLASASIRRLSRERVESPFMLFERRLGDIGSELERIGRGVHFGGHESSVAQTVATLIPTLSAQTLPLLWLISFLGAESVSRESLSTACRLAATNGLRPFDQVEPRDAADAIDQLVGAGVLGITTRRDRVRPHRVILSVLRVLRQEIDLHVECVVGDDVEAYKSIGAIDALQKSISCDPSPGNQLHALELQRQLELVPSKTRGSQLDAMRTAGDLASWVSNTGNLTSAIEVERKLVEAAKRLLGEANRETLVTQNNLAVSLGKAGLLDEAEALAVSVLEKRIRILGPDDEDTIAARNNLATLLMARGEPAHAAREFEECLTSWRARGEESSDRVLAVMNNLALVRLDLGFHTSAIELQDDVVARTANTFGSQHVRTLMARSNRSTMTYAAGLYSETFAEQIELVDALDGLLGTEHPDTLMARANLATSSAALGKSTEALDLNGVVLEARERVLGPTHPDTLTSKNNLGDALCATGDFESAIQLYNEVIRAREMLLGPDHPKAIVAANNKASALFASGEVNAALGLQRQVHRSAVKIMGPDHPVSLGIESNLASSLLVSGEVAEAIAVFIGMIQTLEAKLGENHPNTLTARFNLANATLMSGNHAEAERLHKEILAVRTQLLGIDHPDTSLSFQTVAIASAVASGALPPEALQQVSGVT